MHANYQHQRAQAWRVIAPTELVSIGSSRLLGTIAGGEPIDALEGDLGELVLDLNAIGIGSRNETFALRVEGDSMNGAGIAHGDVVIIERRNHKSGDIVAAVVDNQVTLKRYYKEADHHVLRAANTKYRDIILPAEPKVHGVAISVIRKL